MPCMVLPTQPCMECQFSALRMTWKYMLILYHNVQFASYTAVNIHLLLFEFLSRVQDKQTIFFGRVKDGGHFKCKMHYKCWRVHSAHRHFFSLVNMNDGLMCIFRLECISSDFPFDFTKCFQYKVQPPLDACLIRYRPVCTAVQFL